MSDLISRKAAIDIADDLRACISVEGYWAWTERLKKLPSAAEVVRCRDCKYYEIYQLKKDGTEDRRHRPSYCVILSYKTRPDWFCADGERREDEAD